MAWIDLLFIFLFLIKLLFSTLYQIRIFQEKEYRLDRISVYFSDNFLRLFLESNLLISTNILVSKFLFGDLVFLLLTLLYLSIDLTQVIFQIINHRLKRPKLTGRVIMMTGLTLLMLATLITVLISSPYSRLQFIDTIILFNICNALLITFSFTALILTGIITYPFKFNEIRKAKLKMQTFSDIKVIAITGSYGKSSMKEILTSILSTKYNVVSTFENENTQIGIARVVNNKLNSQVEIFVVEAGAYKRGEVKKAMQITPPDISILTGINDQHSELFGGIENTKKAKYEIVEALGPDGIAIYNADDSNVAHVMANFKGSKKPYSLREKTLQTDSVHLSTKGTEFDLYYKNQKYHCVLPLLGMHNVLNLLGAMTCSLAVGMEIDEVLNSISNIKPKKQALDLIKHKSGATLIDDSYNTNPTGFLSALGVISEVGVGRKIFITSGFLEMRNVSKIYNDIFSNFDSKDIEFYVTTSELLKQFRKFNLNVNLIEDKKQFNGSMFANLTKDDVILIEGSLRQDIYSAIKKL